MWPALECGEGNRSRPSRPAEWAPQGASTWLPAHLGQGLPALDSGAPGRPMEAVRFQSRSPRPLKATLHSSPARAPHGALHAAPGSCTWQQGDRLAASTGSSSSFKMRLCKSRLGGCICCDNFQKEQRPLGSKRLYYKTKSRGSRPGEV